MLLCEAEDDGFGAKFLTRSDDFSAGYIGDDGSCAEDPDEPADGLVADVAARRGGGESTWPATEHSQIDIQ